MPFERREDESFDVVLEVARNDNNSQSSALKLSSKNRLISDYESGTSSSGCCDASCFSNTTGTSSYCLRHSNKFTTLSNNGLPNQRRYDASARCKRAWCHMAYWERDVRVGNLLSVDEPFAFCYFSLPTTSVTGNYLNLQNATGNSLNLQNADRTDRPETVLRTRQKIERGFILYITKKKIVKSDEENDDLLDGDVFLHNRGPSILFVRSNYLHKESAVRLLPGYTLLVHRFDCGDSTNDSSSLTNFIDRFRGGPSNPPTVLISFAKGWGNNYSRTFITCCPCWVEVIFAR